jgi:hypothetical protein
MKKIATCLLPVLGLVCMSAYFGCRTLSTSQTNPRSGSTINGMLYYLPIDKITIKGEYATAEANPAASPKQKQQSTIDANGKGTEISPTPTPTPSPSPTPKELTITLTAEVEADDECGVYYVTPQLNYMYEDEVQVAVNAKHLLSTGKVTTEDKTAEIVGALASLARTGMGLKELEAVENQRPFNFSFHPSNRCEIDIVTGKLKEHGIDLTVTMDRKEITKCTPVPSDKEVQKLAAEFGKSGLIFRPAASYKVRLTGSDLDNTQQFLLPDPTKLYTIEYRRMPFVKKVKEIGFTDGMLTDYHQKVPSPILGFLGIPKAILQAMVPIPGAAGPSGSASSSGTTSPQ